VYLPACHRLHGKDKTASLGRLESVSLAEAHIAAEAARKLAAEGHNLTAVKLRREPMPWYERTLIAARDDAAVVKIGRQKA
jgi:Arm domain-containing DNA-binding protein